MRRFLGCGYLLTGRATRALAVAISIGGIAAGPALADQTILNVSYDPTRELYKEYDAAFAAHWQETAGETVTIEALTLRGFTRAELSEANVAAARDKANLRAVRQIGGA